MYEYLATPDVYEYLAVPLVVLILGLLFAAAIFGRNILRVGSAATDSPTTPPRWEEAEPVPLTYGEFQNLQKLATIHSELHTIHPSRRLLRCTTLAEFETMWTDIDRSASNLLSKICSLDPEDKDAWIQYATAKYADLLPEYYDKINSKREELQRKTVEDLLDEVRN